MSVYDLGEQDIQFYQENGYLRMPYFFTKEEMSELGAALDKIVENKRPRILGEDRESSDDIARVFKQLVNLWVDNAVVRKFSLDPCLAEVARKLAQCRHVVIYHDQALIKPAGERSKETNWHQDAPYYPMEQPGALSAWIAVDDVSIENGCMQFIPASHKYGCLEPVPLDIEGASVLKNIEATGATVDVEPVIMEMEAGGVSFHHGCTFHYATTNRTNKPRRALAIIYIPDYVTYDGRWAASGATDLEAGKPFDGPQHPILARGK